MPSSHVSPRWLSPDATRPAHQRDIDPPPIKRPKPSCRRRLGEAVQSNQANLTRTQHDTLVSIADLNLKTARAYRIRLAFQELYIQTSREAALAFFKKWYFWATHSKLQPMIEAARTIKRHQDGILRWFDTKIANGLLEGINSLVQAAKAKARGYRSSDNLKAIIYLIAGTLEMRLPT